MAKTSMKIKANRPQKFKVREYTRCQRCGRPYLFQRTCKSRQNTWRKKIKLVERK